MELPPSPRRLELEKVGGVVIVDILDARIVDDLTIQEVGDQLVGLVDHRGCRNLLINFGRVRALSSAALAKLFTLRKRVAASKGKLRFCCIHPDLMEVFHLQRARGADPLLEIYPDEQKALDSF